MLISVFKLCCAWVDNKSIRFVCVRCEVFSQQDIIIMPDENTTSPAFSLIILLLFDKIVPLRLCKDMYNVRSLKDQIYVHFYVAWCCRHQKCFTVKKLKSMLLYDNICFYITHAISAFVISYINSSFSRFKIVN